MNYLAHIFLARQSEDAMLGAMLGDFVKADISGKYSREIEAEIYLHRKIDSFTDHHPVVREARQLFPEGRRRYAGILLDIFYDHVLAKDWNVYCDVPLQDFIKRFYNGLLQRQLILPANFAPAADRMIAQDWLGRYQEFSGVRVAIDRTSQRLSKNGHLLREGLIDVEEHYAALSSGFHLFFPELLDFVAEERKRHATK